MSLILRLLLTAFAVFILAYFLPGVTLSGDVYVTSIIVAIVLAVLNVFVKPILIILTLPITVVTLGLFLLVINALIILLADKLIDGFSVSSIWTAILFSILLSVLQSFLYSLLNEDKKPL
ncbi:phage holin family protein [Mariniflexile gromovii]|uniref:Phage holin family protein n=1 Tax=Mariniflexile gromovii TaxID=362523 RepID=A0ABS4BRC3_9FLAO|nr:phage holin family protein [Mariniflexile gromovii]MBP0902591.1 phage holin family protein [Mariniflexile gromovii]